MPFFAEVIIPVAVYKPYTYLVPDEYSEDLQIGMRVEVQFGKSKIYSGIVAKINQAEHSEGKLKPILNILDDKPIVHIQQIEFWKWISSYYVCSLGEVMLAALPGALKISSETVLIYNTQIQLDEIELSDDEYILTEALSIQLRLTVQEMQQILQKKHIINIAKQLTEKNIAHWEEEFTTKYKPKTKEFVRISKEYQSSDGIQQLLSKTARSEKQTTVVLFLYQQHTAGKETSRKEVQELEGVDSGLINRLKTKGLIDIYTQETSRLEAYEQRSDHLSPLAPFQEVALKEIRESLETKQVCVMHGVTGCGKTRIYQEIIQDVIEQGGQVLYMLPEISLSAQMELRLQKTYGQTMLTYHSKINNQKRVEIWKAVYEGHSLVVGARSSLFLPFKDLRLIIVDEEHDQSFKQYEPAPRYHARDAALYLASIHNTKVLLGSATPSIETLSNAALQKFALVKIDQRYGDVDMPEIKVVDLGLSHRQNRMASIFSTILLTAIEECLNLKEKIILFQNRRGFAPMLRCKVCAWKAECSSCDITLTHHKRLNLMKCHYCNQSTAVPASCPSCGSPDLELKGFGTEKIEEEIKVFFPDIRVQRFDADTTSNKSKLSYILEEFDSGEIDMLVGTQMVTKGLDFENVGLVGILLADQMMFYPDFRASERAFQLFTQVAGRAGRRKKRGKVIIQTFSPDHPVMREVLSQDQQAFYAREWEERRAFLYPPLVKLIRLTILHQDQTKMSIASDMIATNLKDKFGGRVLGPTIPSVTRLKNKYQSHILIKLEKKLTLIEKCKESILLESFNIRKQKGLSGIRVLIDVDPV